MSNNDDNEKILGFIIIAGLILIIVVAILQVLTIIFMFLTIIAIIATIVCVILGFADEWNRDDYFKYALIALALIIVFFSAGRATYPASEALLNNDLTKGLMQFTALFFQIQIEKLKLEHTTTEILLNVTNSLPSG